MSEHQHTPGPWEPECRSGDWVVISALDKNAVAWPNRPRGNEVEANVRLIAAAPELLDACNQFMAAISQNDDVELRNAISSARKAVNKATGK